MSEGDRVSWAASKGSVTWYSPSPKLEKLFALQTFQKFTVEAGVDVADSGIALSASGLVSIATLLYQQNGFWW
jgi:hypothetical protein